MTDTKKAQKLAKAAERALAEARERKKATPKTDMPNELGGREGPEPTRFGDWEKKGITSDF
ncbi:MAG TPA: DUF1674 domain-containing protein [Rhodobacteraceae bacterium]|nr:DUF1674 domain-containing protein [Amylibacter sp.]HAD28514.1 DUF1674 domain-containing protein [Paracoccaceae bacterium]